MLKFKELVRATAARAGTYEPHAELVIKALVQTVRHHTAAGTPVRIPGLGTFKVKERAARIYQNLHTGEPVEVPTRRVLTFRAAKTAKGKE